MKTRKGKPNPGHFGLLNPDKRPHRDTPLAAWCRTTGTSTYKLAREMKADPRAVQNWAEGKNLPSLGYAVLLEITTKGGVPIVSWAGTELFRLWMNNCRFDWDRWMRQQAEGKKRRGPARAETA